ncbi:MULTISPECIES: hypothetical protein [unclassified Burkholderia]|uniref:hypothetical protein n=1 Tax=unclassified Burkholderia TaxID=2613784 RepID=UPI002AB22F3F|nr:MULTISPECIES: hypothetical protein [unclassified Burkholderia]
MAERELSAGGTPVLVFGSDQDRNTILAALRFYQQHGMGEPANRSEAIHDIATNGGEDVSMNDAGIDELCERVNSAPVQLPRLPHADAYEVVCEVGAKPDFAPSQNLNLFVVSGRVHGDDDDTVEIIPAVTADDAGAEFKDRLRAGGRNEDPDDVVDCYVNTTTLIGSYGDDGSFCVAAEFHMQHDIHTCDEPNQDFPSPRM